MVAVVIPSVAFFPTAIAAIYVVAPVIDVVDPIDVVVSVPVVVSVVIPNVDVDPVPVASIDDVAHSVASINSTF